MLPDSVSFSGRVKATEPFEKWLEVSIVSLRFWAGHVTEGHEARQQDDLSVLAASPGPGWACGERHTQGGIDRFAFPRTRHKGQPYLMAQTGGGQVCLASDGH